MASLLKTSLQSESSILTPALSDHSGDEADCARPAHSLIVTGIYVAMLNFLSPQPVPAARSHCRRPRRVLGRCRVQCSGEMLGVLFDPRLAAHVWLSSARAFPLSAADPRIWATWQSRALSEINKSSYHRGSVQAGRPQTPNNPLSPRSLPRKSGHSGRRIPQPCLWDRADGFWRFSP